MSNQEQNHYLQENSYFKEYAHVERASKFSRAALIDLDSVALDFFGVALPLFNEVSGKNLTEHDIHTFDLDVVFGITREQVMEILVKSTYMLDMKPFEHLNDVIQKLHAQKLRIVFSTSRAFAPHCFDHTLEMLNAHNIYFDELHLVQGTKWKFKPNGISEYAIYLDDAPHHIQVYLDGILERHPDVPRYMASPVLPYNTDLIADHMNVIGHVDMSMSSDIILADGTSFYETNEKMLSPSTEEQEVADYLMSGEFRDYLISQYANGESITTVHTRTAEGSVAAISYNGDTHFVEEKTAIVAFDMVKEIRQTAIIDMLIKAYDNLEFKKDCTVLVTIRTVDVNKRLGYIRVIAGLKVL